MQTADGRNHSTQFGRNAVQQNGRHRFAGRPISFPSQPSEHRQDALVISVIERDQRFA